MLALNQFFSGSLQVRTGTVALYLDPHAITRAGSAANAVGLPKPEKWAICEAFVVPAIGSRKVTRAQGPVIGQHEDAFQPLDFGDGKFYVHLLHYPTQPC